MMENKYISNNTLLKNIKIAINVKIPLVKIMNYKNICNIHTTEIISIVSFVNNISRKWKVYENIYNINIKVTFFNISSNFIIYVCKSESINMYQKTTELIIIYNSNSEIIRCIYFSQRKSYSTEIKISKCKNNSIVHIFKTSKTSKTSNSIVYISKIIFNTRKFIVYMIKYLKIKTKLVKKLTNKINHIINGNINSLRIVTWNKNSKQAIDSINRIESVIKDNKIDVLLINEFNLSTNDDKSLIKIKGYNIELDQIYENLNKARSAMYIREDLKYSRCKKFENKEDSSIVIKIGLPKKKKFYIYGIYRQWQILNNKKTRTIDLQEKRWEKTL